MVEEDVQSPCINVCRLDPDVGLCTGCYRTEEEIVRWMKYSNKQKRAVIDELPARRTQYQKPRVGN